MTRDEQRAALIEAMARAWLVHKGIDYDGQLLCQTIKNMTAAFDVLSTAGARVCPVEATEEMNTAANKEWDGRMSARSSGVWEAMSAAGDLTNKPEGKP